MKPVIVTMTRGLGQSLYDGMSRLGTLYYWDELDEQQKKDIGPKTEILSVYPLIPVNEQVLDQFPNLKYIASWGVGYDLVDLKALAQRNIIFTNTPNANFADVADLVFGLIVSLVRHIPQLHQNMMKTHDTNTSKGPGQRVSGKKIGIAGLGHIGQEVAQRATGFRMQIGYFDRSVDDRYQRFDSLESLAQWADFLVLAMPATPETFHIVGANVLKQLGPNGYLINIGRGALVDTNALCEALRNQSIAGAALDVFEHEPNIDPRLTELDNIVLTPHIGGSTIEAQQDAAQAKLRNIEAYLNGQELVGRIV